MKRKLLLAALCVVSALGFKANAQKDVTSTYITNATLKDGYNTGWTTTNFNAGPTQGHNTEGYAVESYAGWGSVERLSYSMKQTITLPAGNYRLVNYSFYRYGENYNTDDSKSEAYLCAGETKVKIATLGSIAGQAAYANNMEQAANRFETKMYRNVVEFSIDADDTEISVGVEGTHSEAKSWFICGMFELFDLDDVASVSSPTDMTYAITNPGFEYLNLTGWTNDGFAYIDNNDNIGGKSGAAYIEYYKWGGLEDNKSISQTLTGLDNGLYEVTVYGHQQQGTPNDGVKLYANDDFTYIGSTTQNYSVRTTVKDGNLTIMIKTEGSTANWTAFDKFRLKFYGDPLEAYQALLDAAVDEAKDLIADAVIPSAAKTAWQAVVDDNDNHDKAFTEESQFSTAIANIEAANTTYLALENPYSVWQMTKSLADALAGLTYAETVSGSHTTFTDAISAQNTAAEASTTAEAINTASATLKNAIKTYMSGATLTFVSELNFTCMIENPSFETGDFAGWTNTGMALQMNASFGKTGTYYAEKWEPADDTKYGVKQTISSLPAGAYILSAHAKARAVESAKVYAGSKETAVTIADSETDYDVEFVSTGSDVEIGFEGEGNGTGSSWLCVDNFTLTYLGYAATSEEKAALAAAITAAEAKTLGFEDNEYAPYNNIDAITKLAEAKAIDTSTASGTDVVAATTALTSATWTKNVGEQNAIYWEDYTSGDIAGDGYIHPLGWTNTGYNTRIYSEAAGNKDTNTGISAVNGLAIMMKYNTTYGETTGYTMPLKAGKIYKISFKYCGWGNTPTTNIVLTDPSDNTISLAPGFRPATNDGNTNAEHWYDYTGYFVSTTAGNYVLAMNKVESGQQQIGIGDVEIVSASELEFADGSVPTYAPGTYPSVKVTRSLTANRWATAIYPFAVDASEAGVTVATLTSFTEGTLAFSSAEKSEANVPFMMMSASNKSEFTLEDVAVAATSPTAAEAGDAAFNGVYSTTTVEAALGHAFYVMSNNQIFRIEGTSATVNPYRGYFDIDTSSSAKSIRFVVDGQASDVTAPEVVETEEPEILFNMAGIQVDKNFKGIVTNQKGEKRINR